MPVAALAIDARQWLVEQQERRAASSAPARSPTRCFSPPDSVARDARSSKPDDSKIPTSECKRSLGSREPGTGNRVFLLASRPPAPGSRFPVPVRPNRMLACGTSMMRKQQRVLRHVANSRGLARRARFDPQAPTRIAGRGRPRVIAPRVGRAAARPSASSSDVLPLPGRTRTGRAPRPTADVADLRARTPLARSVMSIARAITTPPFDAAEQSVRHEDRAERQQRGDRHQAPRRSPSRPVSTSV